MNLEPQIYSHVDGVIWFLLGRRLKPFFSNLLPRKLEKFKFVAVEINRWGVRSHLKILISSQRIPQAVNTFEKILVIVDIVCIIHVKMLKYSSTINALSKKGCVRCCCLIKYKKLFRYLANRLCLKLLLDFRRDASMAFQAKISGIIDYKKH